MKKLLSALIVSGVAGLALSGAAHAGTFRASVHGIYVYANANSATVAQVANGPFPDVQGFDWVVGWNDIENAKGVWTFSTLTSAISAAAAMGEGSQIAVIVGEKEPAWVTAACPDIVVENASGDDETIANPIKTCYQNLLATMIAKVGTEYAGNTNVVSIQATGLGLQGEMQLGTLVSAGTWATYGITPTTLLNGWETTLTDWRTATPNIPNSIAIEEPLGSSLPMLQSLLSWIQTTDGGWVTVQQNGLKDTTQEGTCPPTSGAYTYWCDIKLATAWTVGGWQMNGSGSANGVLENAFKIGLAANATYFQVYTADITASSQTAALDYLAGKLGT
jgi:hypothetical protein